MPRATIQDIAKICGVSRATVSAVLHGKDWVSGETRSMIQRALRENNYHHHLIADSLSERFSKMVGVIVGNILNPFNTELIASLQDVLENKGYFIVHHSTNESYEGEVKALRALQAYQFGGYVVAPVQEGRPHDHIRRIIASGKPLVSIGEIPNLETHVVDFDDRQGSKDATDFLIAHGHRDIVCLAGSETSLFAKHRIMGFVESLMDHGLSFEEHMIVRTGPTFDHGYAAAREALANRLPRPTAVLCFNDVVATGVYRCAYDMGVRIPADLSVVGFDDVQLAAILGPPLTTVATYPAELGRATGEMLLTLFEGGPRNGFLRRISHPKLIERYSVTAI